MVPDPAHRRSVLEDVRTLIEAPAPFLDQIERTLADAYAHALALEAEQLRLQRRLGELAATLEEGAGAEQVGELSALGRRLAGAGGDLVELRELLGSLQRRARQLRAA